MTMFTTRAYVRASVTFLRHAVSEGISKTGALAVSSLEEKWIQNGGWNTSLAQITCGPKCKWGIIMK
jgi:hypothetical protein